MKGAFLISREIFENPIWDDVQKFRIFFYILGNAVFSEEGIKKGDIHIQRGQFLRSYRNLQKDLEYVENRSVKQYSLSTIKRKVNQLIEENRLKIEDTELGTLFTVCNYDRYQLLDNYKKELGTQRERRENGDGTEMERRENNNKYVKKEKNVNKDMYTSEFESFWSEYPRKIDKKKALKSFKTVMKRYSLDDIVRGTKGYAESVKDTEPRFIKHASTFLNNESFVDYLEKESSNLPKEEPKSEEELIREQINEIEGTLKLGEDYFRAVGNPNRYSELVKRRDELNEQLRAN